MLLKKMCFFVSCLFSPFALAGLLDSGYPDPWPVFRSISNYSSAMEEIARREESERRFYILAGLNLVILIAICFSSLKRKAFFSLSLAGCIVISAFSTEGGRSFIGRYWGGSLSREIKSLFYGWDAFLANIYGKMSSLGDAGGMILFFLGACVIAFILLRLLGD